MNQQKTRLTTLVLIGLGLILSGLTFQQAWRVQANGGLPVVSYLGESGSFNVGEGYNFIVKAKKPFVFTSAAGPSYRAKNGERVWSVLGGAGAPRAVDKGTYTIGPVEAGCVVYYASIDDDVDDRVNYFLLDGTVIHTMGQGMTVRGRFIVPQSGTLSYQVNDSIGLFLRSCEAMNTPPPQATQTPVPTNTPMATPTLAVATAEPDIATATPAVTNTPEPTPTPEQKPRLPSCTRINFDISGHKAKEGLYVVQEVGGRHLVSWEAREGWQDSGWFYDLDITFSAVYVQVLYYQGPDAEPVYMKIINPAPDSEHGWLARGQCHALEVAWAD